MTEPAAPVRRRRGAQALSVAVSLVPLLLFWILESTTDLRTAIFVAMSFGVGELVFTFLRHKKVERLSLVTTGLVLATGVGSLYLQSGLLFKLKPAVVELVVAGVFIGSVVLGRPLFLSLAEKQTGRPMPPTRRDAFKGITLRFGLSFVLHAALTVYAAVSLSTGAWAFIKGIGTLVVLGAYLLFEISWIRWYLRPRWIATEKALARARARESADAPRGSSELAESGP